MSPLMSFFKVSNTPFYISTWPITFSQCAIISITIYILLFGSQCHCISCTLVRQIASILILLTFFCILFTVYCFNTRSFKTWSFGALFFHVDFFHLLWPVQTFSLSGTLLISSSSALHALTSSICFLPPVIIHRKQMLPISRISPIRLFLWIFRRNIFFLCSFLTPITRGMYFFNYYTPGRFKISGSSLISTSDISTDNSKPVTHQFKCLVFVARNISTSSLVLNNTAAISFSTSMSAGILDP